jgi:hypothetical protein
MKILSVGAEFHADRRTDRHDESNSGFSQFANAPKKVSPFHAIKAYSRSRGIAPLIRNLRRRRVIQFSPSGTSKPRGQKTRCPVNWVIGGSRKKNPLPLPGYESRIAQAVAKVATPTTLTVLRVWMARFKSAYTVSQNTTSETSNDPQGSYEQISHPYGKKVF